MIKENIVVLDLEKYEELRKYKEAFDKDLILLHHGWDGRMCLIRHDKALESLNLMNENLKESNNSLSAENERLLKELNKSLKECINAGSILAKEHTNTFISHFKRIFTKE